MAGNARKVVTRLLNSVSVSNKFPKNLTIGNTKGVCFSSSADDDDDEEGLDRIIYRRRPVRIRIPDDVAGTNRPIYLEISVQAEWCGIVIQSYIEKAVDTDDDDISSRAFNKALSLLISMKGMSFEVTEQTYEPLMRFIIERRMADEFRTVHDHFRKEHQSHLPKLAYYETLLQRRMLLENDKESDVSGFRHYQLAYLETLSEEGRKNDVLMLLTTFDILKVSSQKNMEIIFKSLGMLQLESHAKSFILKLQAMDKTSHDLYNLICIYAMSIPMLQIQETVQRVINLRAELKVQSSAVPFQKLIETCCHKQEVNLALDLADCMLKDQLKLGINTFNLILTACEKRFDYYLVNRVYPMILQHDVSPNLETFKMMVNMFMKMDKFDEAYDIIKELKTFGLYPSVSMCNAIINGYLRKNEFDKGVGVLKEMDAYKVKPDAYTFRLIIANCSTEELILKYLKKFEDYGVPPTKQVFFALVSAYTSYGLVEKAKQVLEDKTIPYDDLNEFKSMLVSELATKGHMSDALAIYDEMRQAREKLEPKAVLVLIQHGQDKCELRRLLELLNQLEDYDLWVSGCDKIISFCVGHKLLSSAVDLLKQRVQKATNEIHIDSIFYEPFAEIAEMEPADIQFGMDLLRAVREDLGIQPPRQCLDFLLTASVKAKEGAVMVWKEYELAGLPYNPVTFSRMHQALLAAGHHEQADLLLQNMPKYDSHVHSYIDPLLKLSKGLFT